MNATSQATAPRRHLTPVRAARFRPRARLAPAGGLGLAVLLLLSGCGGGDGTKPPQSPVVRVTSPNGGEVLYYGQTHTITWSATDADTEVGSLLMALEYTFDGGAGWISIADNEANDGQYVWTIPQLSSAQSRVRLTVSDGQATAQDESDASFTLVYPQSPVVRVISPNGGEMLYYGQTHTITWSATDADTEVGSLLMALEYTLDGGASWISIADNEANDGQYVWTIPQLSSAQSRVRLTVSDGQATAQDESDASFTLVYTPPPPPLASTVSVGDGSGAPFSEVTVPLTLDNRATAINLQSTLVFNDEVLSFVNAVAVGRGLAFQFGATLQGPGQVIVRFQAQNQSVFAQENSAIAQLTFRLIGAGGSASNVTPQLTQLRNQDGNPLNVRNVAGTIEVLDVSTPETLTLEGWALFEAGDFNDALGKFDEAIGLDAQHGPAYTGRGWSQLQLATTSADFQHAVTAFDAAIARQQTGADGRSGRAAALLAVGGGQLQEAVAEAGRAAQAAPQFVFAHRTSVDLKDVRLIEAFAQAGRGRITDARDAADRITASNIRAGDPNSWEVDGVRYPTFESAVLAFLHKMSNQHAG